MLIIHRVDSILRDASRHSSDNPTINTRFLSQCSSNIRISRIRRYVVLLQLKRSPTYPWARYETSRSGRGLLARPQRNIPSSWQNYYLRSVLRKGEEKRIAFCEKSRGIKSFPFDRALITKDELTIINPLHFSDLAPGNVLDDILRGRIAGIGQDLGRGNVFNFVVCHGQGNLGHRRCCSASYRGKCRAGGDDDKEESDGKGAHFLIGMSCVFGLARVMAENTLQRPKHRHAERRRGNFNHSPCLRFNTGQ